MAQTVSRDYIISALRSGFTDSQIASALGVTQSAVAQLIDNNQLREVATANSRFKTIDEKLNAIEEKALTNLEKQVRYVSDPMKLLKIATGVNNAKRRSLAEGSHIANTTNVQLVQINMPEHLRVDIKLNTQNQVVSVDDRELTTMQSGKLMQRLDSGTELPAPKRTALVEDNSDETSTQARCVADYL